LGSSCQPLPDDHAIAVDTGGTASSSRGRHMAADLPVKLLLITFAGFVNRDQSRLIA
jgi:hypothetical protein